MVSMNLPGCASGKLYCFSMDIELLQEQAGQNLLSEGERYNAYANRCHTGFPDKAK
jgi:hypothetical protein